MNSNALLINEDDIGIVLVSLDVELEQENIEAAFDEIDYDRLYGDLEEYSRKSVSQQRVMAHELIKKQILQAQIF
ncbi:hypothetical protein [Vibrio parahaemolyticus]|uniref:Uncharacterized protein n=1 Tax=Vibrio parahaemolyticus TaxID=670 RepID=A0AAX0MJ23_VIBPH|nr:hypothetical protein [Vibrio parahaemolyticus]MCS0331151.1 hypothetical protein [Vibrio diabolicus]EGQ8302413.1 hypothetical protein [Vibrio parahaemolyticus]EGQ8892747.1 hypothetical protein [Vibrio parahaemolyticus]EGR3309913.1 hypothetical protein [Vibrio parahaemolyticus]EJG0023735.1 hypothetical protein [Vibrio parahaemolyticus]